MSSDDWYIACSDDEIGDVKEWKPPAKELTALYDILDKNELPDLKWKCAGYRSPSPERPVEEVVEKIEPIREDIEQSDFDFEDEVMSPKLKIRKDGDEVLKGSAKKKTTSLDGVLNNMRRHNIRPPKATNDKT